MKLINFSVLQCFFWFRRWKLSAKVNTIIDKFTIVTVKKDHNPQVYKFQHRFLIFHEIGTFKISTVFLLCNDLMSAIREYDFSISIFSLHFELVDERIVPEWQLALYSHFNNSFVLARIQHNFAIGELLFNVLIVKPHDLVTEFAIVNSSILASYP